MTPALVLECAVRAVLIAGATATVLALLRIGTARARHAAWTAVVLSMLLLPIWTALGPKVPLRILSPAVRPASAGRSAAEGSPFPRPGDKIPTAGPGAKAAGPGPRSLAANWRAILAGIYLLGLCILLTRLALGSVHARRLVRAAIQRDGRWISVSCAAPITVGWLRPAVILPECSRHWTGARIEAAVTHEAEHARHRDPLVQWLALLNRAVFWFHPLAWWLERHLAALAEQACDDAVLARGHDPRQYSEFLLDLANSVMRSGRRVHALGMTMPGHFLARRIPYILAQARPARISSPRIACAGGICLFASGLFAAVTLEPKPVPSATAEIRALEHPLETGKDFPVGVLYFDLTGMSRADRMRTAAASRRMIATRMRSPERLSVMVYSAGELRTAKEFTDDKDQLIHAIDQLRDNPGDARNNADIDRRVSALQTAVRTLTPFEGQKALMCFFGEQEWLRPESHIPWQTALANAAHSGVLIVNAGMSTAPDFGVALFRGSLADAAESSAAIALPGSR
jgi:hypothetical protein